MARRDSRDGNALKETRVIWQSATLCRVKKAASSLNNARLFRSQRFRSNRPLAATLEPSNRVAFSFRVFPRFRECKWFEFGSRHFVNQREKEGANSSIDEKQSWGNFGDRSGVPIFRRIHDYR